MKKAHKTCRKWKKLAIEITKQTKTALVAKDMAEELLKALKEMR